MGKVAPVVLSTVMVVWCISSLLTVMLILPACGTKTIHTNVRVRFPGLDPSFVMQAVQSSGLASCRQKFPILPVKQSALLSPLVHRQFSPWEPFLENCLSFKQPHPIPLSLTNKMTLSSCQSNFKHQSMMKTTMVLLKLPSRKLNMEGTHTNPHQPAPNASRSNGTDSGKQSNQRSCPYTSWYCSGRTYWPNSVESFLFWNHFCARWYVSP